MNNYKFHYEKKGYVVIENVLNNSEIQNLRKLVKNYFIKRKDENLINVSACYSNPEITKLVMNKKLLTACRQIIGKQVFINELEVQFNSFPNNSKVPPHYDGQSQKNDNFYHFWDLNWPKIPRKYYLWCPKLQFFFTKFSK